MAKKSTSELKKVDSEEVRDTKEISRYTGEVNKKIRKISDGDDFDIYSEPEKRNNIYKDIVNLPNIISVIRLLLVPIITTLILWPENNGSALTNTINFWQWRMPVTTLAGAIIFFIAGSTDFLDGYIARKYNKVTTLGKFLDPLVDKFLINATLIAMAIALKYQVPEFVINIDPIPLWMILLFMFRDAVMEAVRMYAYKYDIIISASWMGKWKTTIQIIGILVVLFFGSAYFHPASGNFHVYRHEQLWQYFALIPLIIAQILSVVSCIQYCVNFRKQLIKTIIGN